MSSTDKIHVDYLKKTSVDGTIDDPTSDWVLTKTGNTIGWYKLPESSFATYTPEFNPTSLSLNKDWKPSGFLLDVVNGFSNGLYLIKITSGNLIFSGIASVYVGKITVEDEIVLHMSGIPQIYPDGTQGRIYAKIAPSLTADYGEIYLATNVPQSAITNLSITMKKLL